MKKNVIFSFLIFGSIVAMDAPTPGKRKFEESESSEQRAAKAPALQEEEITQASPLQELPGELKVLILQSLATGAPWEIRKAISNLSLTNKNFNAFINDPQTVMALLHFIAQHKKITLAAATDFLNLKTTNPIRDLYDDLGYHELNAARKKLLRLSPQQASLFAAPLLLEFLTYYGLQGPRVEADVLHDALDFSLAEFAKKYLLDANYSVPGFDTLLNYALNNELWNLVRILLAQGANPNAKGLQFTPLELLHAKKFVVWDEEDQAEAIDLLKKYIAGKNPCLLTGEESSSESE